jgi:hypothetical protein
MDSTLSTDQRVLLNSHTKQYIDTIVNNHRYKPAVKLADVKDDIAWIYNQLGASSPPKFIFFANSEMQEKLMFNFIVGGGLSSILENFDNIGSAVYDRQIMIDDIKKQVSSTVGSSSWAFKKLGKKLSAVSDAKTVYVKTINEVAVDLVEQIKSNGVVVHDKINPATSLSYSLIDRFLNVVIAKQMQGSVSSSLYQVVWDAIAGQIDTEVTRGILRPVHEDINLTVLNMVMQAVKPSEIHGYFDTVEKAVAFSSAVSFIHQFMDKGRHFVYSTSVMGLPTFDMAIYSYYKKVGMLKSDEFDRYWNFVNKGVWSMQLYKDWCIITRIPVRISRDAQNRLHSLDGSAIEWRGNLKVVHPFDGRQYYIHGIPFDEQLWDKTVNNKITISEILGIKNMEQRQAVFSAINPMTFIKECGGKCVSTHVQKKQGDRFMSKDTYSKINHEEIKLFEIKDVAKLGLSRTLYIMLYKDPSTEREYYMFVNPRDSIDAATAMAVSLGLTKDEYLRIAAES